MKKIKKRKLLLTFLALTCLVKLSLSQVVGTEIVGRDTFPLATVYNGVPVSVFTDSQTTTLAMLVVNNNFNAKEIERYKQKESEYKTIISMQSLQKDTMRTQIDDALQALALSKANNDDLKLNLIASEKKYSSQKIKNGLRLGLGIVGSFLLGLGSGATAVALKK
jgi:hypothetical protein